MKTFNVVHKCSFVDRWYLCCGMFKLLSQSLMSYKPACENIKQALKSACQKHLASLVIFSAPFVRFRTLTFNGEQGRLVRGTQSDTVTVVTTLDNQTWQHWQSRRSMPWPFQKVGLRVISQFKRTKHLEEIYGHLGLLKLHGGRRQVWELEKTSSKAFHSLSHRQGPSSLTESSLVMIDEQRNFWNTWGKLSFLNFWRLSRKPIQFRTSCRLSRSPMVKLRFWFCCQPFPSLRFSES